MIFNYFYVLYFRFTLIYVLSHCSSKYKKSFKFADYSKDILIYVTLKYINFNTHRVHN